MNTPIDKMKNMKLLIVLGILILVPIIGMVTFNILDADQVNSKNYVGHIVKMVTYYYAENRRLEDKLDLMYDDAQKTENISYLKLAEDRFSLVYNQRFRRPIEEIVTLASPEEESEKLISNQTFVPR